MVARRLAKGIAAASLGLSLLVTMALALSLTPTGSQALRGLAAAANARVFPWAPVTALADCGPPNTSGGGTPPPNTSGGGTPPPNTSGGGTPPPNTSGGGTCTPPTVFISPPAPVLCAGASTNLTAVVNGGALPETVSWSPAAGLSSTTGFTVTASPATTTTYTATATDATNATASASVTVTVHPAPSVSISGAPGTGIALGTGVSLTATAGGGTAPYSFIWSRGTATTTSPTSTDTDTPVAVGNATYLVTITDAAGCGASASTTVHVYDFTVSLSPADETVLAGTPAAYTVNAGVVPGSTGTPSSVSLTISGGPSGATITAPTTIGLPSTGNPVSVTPTTASTSLGNFTLFASASAGGVSRTGTANLHVYDFSLTVAPPSQTVLLGGGPAAYAVSTTLATGSTGVGLPASVGLSISGLPGSITPTMAPSTTLGGTTSLSLAIGSTPPGSYNFTVTGSVPGGSRSGSGQLIISFNVCVLYDQTQVKKAGSTIPIKLELCDAAGNNVSSSSIIVHAVRLHYLSGTVADVTPDDSGNANPDNDFRFDGGLGVGGGYIYNLSTKGLASGRWALEFMASGDPTLHSVQFVLKS